MPKLFTKNDSGFICGVCGRGVPPLVSSSRNHCPFCLASLHVDINPGDRAEPCRGTMLPKAVSPHPQKGYVITHRCVKCGRESKNRCANDDDVSLLIKYTNPHNIPVLSPSKNRPTAKNSF